ncbi:MAG: aminotransferase class III-fold pyridoxal phosphate-dependent enzyme, partial [Candidatus Thorarchaeota archaeon]|nr:aminotransferase class III-fold pyridoxal phosphate-dependent enzyme [Candidatus Thorarchaeota archaeon]NIW13970.1 aminotransferase class III-fold pyridoxal phosphate-dependent enzyme [Candidatus Thorarchaeota archaeon]NIW52109.1 aminotransferase class III-fold pyridoxal phosphate-dependent enzyme [Candidatus Korarchaeota archaeon]
AVYEKENKKLLERTKRSEEIYKLSAEVTPFGVHSNYRAMDPYPIYFTKGKGSKLWDADGNEYIDFHMAFGVLVAGHSHPVLVEAMKD